MLDLSVVITTKDRPDLTANVINRLKNALRNFNYEIIIVDNGKINVDYDAKVIITNKNLGFPRGTNYGAEYCRPSNWLLTIHNDFEPQEDFLNKMISCAEKFSAPLVGGIYNDHEGMVFDRYGMPRLVLSGAANGDTLCPVQCMFFTVALIDRSIWDKFDGFDPQFKYDYFEVDFALKLHELDQPIALANLDNSRHAGDTTIREPTAKLEAAKDADRYVDKWLISNRFPAVKLYKKFPKYFDNLSN